MGPLNRGREVAEVSRSSLIDLSLSCSSAMAHKSKKAPRNFVAVAMAKRYGGGSKVMKDRRAPRGGNRNLQREYREDF